MALCATRSRRPRVAPLPKACHVGNPRAGTVAIARRELDLPHHTWLARWAFQRLAVPFRGIGRSLVCALQEFQEGAVGIGGGAHCVIGQKEFAKRFAEEGGIWSGLDRAITGRLGIGIGIERGIIDRAAARPEAGAAFLV